MENKKWEQIENQIRQFIDEHAFERAFQLLKKSALQKGNMQLVEEIAELKKLFDKFKAAKKKNQIPPEEVQSAEYDLAYKLSYFIDCLRKGGATFAKPPRSHEMGATAGAGMDISAGADTDISADTGIGISPVVAPPTPQMSESMPTPKQSPPASMPSASGAEASKVSASKPKKISAKQPPNKPDTDGTSRDNREGGILYNIPEKMQLGVQNKCIVRLAFDKKQLKRDTDTFTDEVIKTVQVSEVMEVDLIDISGEDAFKIQFISQKEQFIDRNGATEWLINVKALKAGSFELALKVAIIEKIDGTERRKETILYDLVAVVGDVVAPSDTFKSVNQPFQPANAQSLLPTDTPSPNNRDASTVKTVLFMGANPPGTEFLQLEIEHSRISFELEGKFRFPASKFLKPSEIPKLFNQHKPNVVHFSGHGKAPSVNEPEVAGSRGIVFPKDYIKTGGIIIFDETMRGMKVIEDKMLDLLFATAVQKLQIPIEVVLFNSCHSESQAKVVGKSVPYVIGTANAIKDSIAISFAVGFYSALASGQNVEDAFTMGKMQAVMEDLEAETLIVLYKNGEKTAL
jgi:hypothetical protein